MKKLFSTLFLSFLVLSISAQTICNPTGNLVIFTNYDGGPLNINVDVNIPDLKIGVVSYRAVSVNITGPFASNVTGVAYAGFNSSATCGVQAILTTSISAPPGATTNITNAPPAPISNPNGHGSIICGYSCDLNSSQGGCNTADQVEAYFLNYFPNTLVYSHEIQYGCWSGSQSLQATGNCCATVIPLTAQVQAQDASCFNACDGSASVTASGGQSPYTYAWSNSQATSNLSNVCAGQYTVTVTDAAQNTTTQTVQINEPGLIEFTQNFVDCRGFSIQVGTNTYTITGNYVDTLQSVSGCDSVVHTGLTIRPIKTFTQSFTPNRCEGFSVQVENNTYSATGVYIDTLQTARGCDSVVTTEIVVDSIIIIDSHPDDVTVDAGDPASFSISLFETSADIQWQVAAIRDTFSNIRPGLIYTGQTTNLLTVLEADLGMDSNFYRALVTLEQCVDTTSSARLFVTNRTSVNENNYLSEVRVYPNPVQEQLHIEYNGELAGERFMIYSSTGALVFEGTLFGSLNTVNTASWASGIYSVMFESSTEKTIKIIKK